MTVTDISMLPTPRRTLGTRSQRSKLVGIPAIGRLVVGRAVDIVEDRPRQPPLGERPEVMEVMAVLQAHRASPSPGVQGYGERAQVRKSGVYRSRQRLTKVCQPKACVARKPWHFGSMTDAKDDLALAAEFPAATREQWLALVDKALKGAPFEKKLVGKTYDGLRIEPLYPRRSDAAPLAGRDAGRSLADHGAGRSSRSGGRQPTRARRSRRRRHRRGAASLRAAIGAYGYGADLSADGLERILDGVFLEGIAIEFDLTTASQGRARRISPRS